MKTRIFCMALVATMLVAQSAVVLAQGTSSGWSAVQSIRTDERLIIRLKDGKTVEGKMIEANDSNLSISRDKKVVNLARADIQSIHHTKGKAAKGKWAVVGTGIGAGTGAAIGAAKASSTSDDGEIYTVVGLALGAGIGAIGGALFGTTRSSRELIYQAP